jgi:two-component system chemotaxis response regulator CheB
MNTEKKKTTVLVVDDSAYMRRLISDVLNSDPEIEVLDTASDPLIARNKLKNLNPDVMTLDIQMPNMNGLEFLERIMAHRPMPVIMISSLTENGADETIKALELGAVDYVTKPTRDIEQSIARITAEICEKVKMAARAKLKVKTVQQISNPEHIILAGDAPKNTSNRYIAIGSSTGGVEALSEIINSLPPSCPPILITQHMPEKFTTSFAARLNKTSSLTVHEAVDGQLIESNHVYLAPGGYHLGVRKVGGRFVTQLNDGALISGHKPSVDYLFTSIAHTIPAAQVTAFILTGMGKDGAQGLKKLKDLGADTYGQNEASCVVYGMPRVAKELNAVKKEINLNEVATYIMQSCK